MQSSVIAKIDFPRFDTDDIETWFICLEAVFSVNAIKKDKTKFNAVIVALEHRAKFVYSVIKSCSDSTTADKYDTLKAAVIAHFRPSESQQLTSLLSGMTLGDRKPSALLSEMRRLGGTGCTDSVLANLWLRALPSTVTAIIATMPAKTSLDEQAKVADKILEAPHGESFAVKAEPSSSSSSLELQVAELSSHSTKHLPAVIFVVGVPSRVYRSIVNDHHPGWNPSAAGYAGFTTGMALKHISAKNKKETIQVFRAFFSTENFRYSTEPSEPSKTTCYHNQNRFKRTNFYSQIHQVWTQI